MTSVPCHTTELLLLTHPCRCCCCLCHVAAAVQLRATMQQDLQNMKAVFRQIVFEKAPGARS